MTSYSVNGEGPVIVILHGWGDSSSTFGRLTEPLSAGYKIVALDLPGFGKTQAPPASWGLNDYADFLASFLKKLQLEPYAYIGHSYGGAIAIRGVGTGILHADKLVLLASAGIRDEYMGRKKALRIIAKTAKAATVPLPKTIQHKLKKASYRFIGSDMFVAEHLQEVFKRIITDDVSQDAAKVSIPSLLVYGNDDKVTPVRYGEKFASLMSHSKLEIVEGTGHFIHRDKTAEVSQLILQFLRESS